MNTDTLSANSDIIRLESFLSEADVIIIIVYSKQKHLRCLNCN
jgi:hypothetical protein